MASTKKLLIFTFIILGISLIAGLFPVHGESEIYDTVVRLHVIANSDSESDQALKLRVRDEIIAVVSPAVKDCKNQAEAIAAIGGVIDEIELAAAKVIDEEGYDYPVSVEIGEEHYPTKKYETCAFPEGTYVSLRVNIGEGEGKNWWCCLFPPLCLSAATPEDDESNEDAFISVGFTPDQYKIITETDTPKYKIRFKFLEVFGKLFQK